MEIKVYELEDRPYKADELKEIFDKNKITLRFQDYYKNDKERTFVLLNQTKPVFVDGYPYGRLRTVVKYEIISNNYGESLVFTSKNPKTGVWNKPKKSTYRDLGFLIINADGHITTMSLNYNDGESKNKAFEALIPFMSVKQKIVYSKICGYTETMKHVTFEIKTRLFKHRETGEILEKVDIFDLNNVDECDEDGNLIDKNKEAIKKKENEEIINKHMQYEAVMKYKEIKKDWMKEQKNEQKTEIETYIDKGITPQIIMDGIPIKNS